MQGIHSRTDQTNERIGELEDRLFENTQLKDKKKLRRMKKAYGKCGIV